MTWADVAGGSVKVVQQKTGNKVHIAQHAALRRALDKAPRDHVAILNTAFGRPVTVSGYGNWLRDAISEAGFPMDCKPHGLRKAAGRRLAEVGCAADTIMADLGHSTMEEAERYTREADRARLGEAGIIQLQAQSANRFTQTNAEKFGEAGKSEGDAGC